MKRIYQTLRPPVDEKSYASDICKINQKLSISCRGIIAFTSSFCLNQSRPTSSSYHLYVADANTPNRPYLIAESEHEYTILEWDHFGSKLLSCDVQGQVTIFMAPEHLISDWQATFICRYPSEHFIAAAWYHPGIVNTINYRSPSNHIVYSEKIQKSKFGASLKLFGGKGAEGCLLISSTGLACCLTKFGDNYEVNTQSLSPLRAKVSVADIAFHQDGHFIVGTSAGPINTTILFYKIMLSSKNLTLDDMDIVTTSDNRVKISIEAHNSFHLNVLSQILRERSNNNSPAFEQVEYLKFVTKSSPDDVLVAVKGQNVSLIESWELEPTKPQPIHPLIANLYRKQQNQNENKPSTTNWVFKGNYIMEKNLVAIQTPRTKLFDSQRQLNVILLAYDDNSICCMRREDLSPICEFFNSDKDSSNQASQSFRPNYLANPTNGNDSSRKTIPKHITNIQFSPNQCVYFTVDNMSQLQAIKLPRLIVCQDDQDTYLQYLFEHSLVTGNDHWDVIVCVNHIENICDKLDDAFQRQPKNTQNPYLNRHMTILASLYRCVNTETNLIKAADYHTMIMLNYISSTVKSIVRTQGQDLSSILKQNANQPAMFEINNVIEKLNLREFVSEINLVQSLQPLIQWLTELSIYWIVSRLRAKQQKLTNLGENRDALETVRELLIIIKIWGQQNEHCLPNIYKLDDKLDLIGTIYKLISMINNSMGPELDENTTKECTRFSQSISLPQFSFMLNAIGVASPLLTSRKDLENGLTLEYFQEPTMPDVANLPKIEGAINVAGDRLMDVVRNISLGAHPISNVRSCTRCHSVSLSNHTQNSNRIWEQRWIKQCVCGGSWAQWSGNNKQAKGFGSSSNAHFKLDHAAYLTKSSIGNRSNFKMWYHNHNFTHVPSV